MFDYKGITSKDEEVLSSININYFDYISLNSDAKAALQSEYRRYNIKNSLDEILLTQTSNVNNKPKVKSLIKRITKR